MRRPRPRRRPAGADVPPGGSGRCPPVHQWGGSCPRGQPSVTLTGRRVLPTAWRTLSHGRGSAGPARGPHRAPGPAPAPSGGRPPPRPPSSCRASCGLTAAEAAASVRRRVRDGFRLLKTRSRHFTSDLAAACGPCRENDQGGARGPQIWAKAGSPGPDVSRGTPDAVPSAPPPRGGPHSPPPSRTLQGAALAAGPTGRSAVGLLWPQARAGAQLVYGGKKNRRERFRREN